MPLDQSIHGPYDPSSSVFIPVYLSFLHPFMAPESGQGAKPFKTQPSGPQRVDPLYSNHSYTISLVFLSLVANSP